MEDMKVSNTEKKKTAEIEVTWHDPASPDVSHAMHARKLPSNPVRAGSLDSLHPHGVILFSCKCERPYGILADVSADLLFD
jgi:hypothetical protein